MVDTLAIDHYSLFGLKTRSHSVQDRVLIKCLGCFVFFSLFTSIFRRAIVHSCIPFYVEVMTTNIITAQFYIKEMECLCFYFCEIMMSWDPHTHRDSFSRDTITYPAHKHLS